MEKRRKAYPQSTYIYGNTVRKLDIPPQREEEFHRERQRVNEKNVQANRERAMVMSPGYVIFLTLAAIATVLVCTAYIRVQSELNLRARNIASLQSQVLTLQLDNDASEKRIQTGVNLDEIKDRAIHEFGMTYPSSGQVVYYTVDPDDYMNQYQDIPEKE